MANIKFSAFTQKVALADVDFLVGYTGADNVRVAPSVFSGLYLPLAGGTMTGNVIFNDNVSALFGTSSDMTIKHDGSNSKIENNTGDLYIINEANDKDIIFQSDDGSGGITEYFRVDGGAEEIYFYKDTVHLDNVRSYWGNAGDLEIYHDGSHSYIVDTGTGSLILRGTDFQLNNSANTKNMITATDGGSVNLYYDAVQKFRTVSGGVEVTGTVYITGDGSNAATLTESGSGDFTISSIDDLRLESGGNDIVLRGASSAEFGRLSNDSQNLVIQNTNADKDIVFKGDDAGSAITALTLDMSEAGNASFAGNVSLVDSKNLKLGTGQDLELFHNATDSYIQNSTGNLNIINYANDKDITFQSDDGSGGVTEYFRLDGSMETNRFYKNVRLDDNVSLEIGSGADLQIKHDATDTLMDNYTGHLYIRQQADDKDIIFQSDDGSGGVTTYMTVDGLNHRTDFSKATRHQDSIKAFFGSSNDLEIYHDGSDSYISDTGTGDLRLLSSLIRLRTESGENMLRAETNAGVYLYYDNVVKFETSSTGTTTTGQMNIAALNTAPASASAAGTLGEIRYTADYIYVCTATNTWKRTALSTW